MKNNINKLELRLKTNDTFKYDEQMKVKLISYFSQFFSEIKRKDEINLLHFYDSQNGKTIGIVPDEITFIYINIDDIEIAVNEIIGYIKEIKKIIDMEEKDVRYDLKVVKNVERKSKVDEIDVLNDKLKSYNEVIDYSMFEAQDVKSIAIYNGIEIDGNFFLFMFSPFRKGEFLVFQAVTRFVESNVKDLKENIKSLKKIIYNMDEFVSINFGK